jgi:general secretion pathway protein A
VIGSGTRYLKFYGVSEQPFGESPNPRYLYTSAELSHTFAALLRNVEAGQRAQILTARPGLGKTTLLYAIRERLADRVSPAFVFPFGGGAELLGIIIRALALHEPSAAIGARRETLQRFFWTSKPASKHFLLLIDEAQNLDGSAFQEIEYLLANAPKSLQVILSGQTQLAAALDNTAPSSLRDRITATHHLSPLNREDTGKYVLHRLCVAGYAGPELFTPDSLDLIAVESSGFPRNINTLCFQALEYGSRNKLTRIDTEVVTKILPRCAFRGSCLVKMPDALYSDSATSVSESEHIGQQGSTLAALIGGWLTTHAGAWSGTSWELYQQLRSVNRIAFDQLAIASHVELDERLFRNSLLLREAGIQVEVRSRRKPRQLTLRLIGNSLSSKIA